MNKRMLRTIAMAIALAGIGGLASRAQAQGGTTDTMVVSVTPLVNWSVYISSPYASGYNFGNVALSATTVSTMSFTLTNNGNASEYFGLSISNTSGGWTPTAAATGVDTFRLAALESASQPLPAAVGWANFLTNAPYSGTAAGNYGQASKTGVGTTTTGFWMRLEMPTQLSAGTTVGQTMTLTATAQGS